MVNLLAIWKAQGLDVMLREAWQAGVVLAGLSAGSMCWFEWGNRTGSGHAAPLAGLGFLPGSNTLPPGHAVDDGAALIVRGTTVSEVVSARDGARAYAVTREGEEPLAARLIAPTRAIAPAATAVAELRRLRLSHLAD